MLDLNIDVAEVSTALPLLPAADYAVKVKKAEIVESKKTARNYNLMVQVGLSEPATSVTGETLHAGFPLRRYYPLQQSETEGAPDFRRDLKLLIMAAHNIKEDADCPAITNDTIASLNGQEMIASVKIQKDDQYGEQNSIASFRAIG